MAFPLCKAKKFKTCGFGKKLSPFKMNLFNFLPNPQVLNFFALHNGKAIAKGTLQIGLTNRKSFKDVTARVDWICQPRLE